MPSASLSRWVSVRLDGSFARSVEPVRILPQMVIEETQINQGLLDAALEVSARRADTLRQVRRLLVDGEDRKAVDLMKKFLNVNEDKPSRAIRASSRLSLVKGK